MKNWTCAVQTNGNKVQTYINKVETDCSPSLQTDETQPNEKI